MASNTIQSIYHKNVYYTCKIEIRKVPRCASMITDHDGKIT